MNALKLGYTKTIGEIYEIPFGELNIGPQIDVRIEEEGIHYMFDYI